MSLTISVFAHDVGGGERMLRRSPLSDVALTFYRKSPDVALAAMLPIGGTQPDEFRISDDRGRLQIAYTAAQRRENATKPRNSRP